MAFFFREQPQQLRGAAVAQDLLEFRTVVGHETHPLDHEVDDLPAPVRLAAQPVVHEHVVGSAAHDLRLHGPVAARLLARAGDLDGLVVVALDVAPVGEGQVAAELVHELALLRLGEAAPVAREHEPGKRGEVGVRVDDVLEPVPLLVGAEAVVAEHRERGVGHLRDDGPRRRVVGGAHHRRRQRGEGEDHDRNEARHGFSSSRCG